MNTKIHRHFRVISGEHRLISLDSTRRHDLLDEAEATKGTMDGGRSLGKLEGETQKLAKQILSQRVSWGEWINHFFSSGSVLDRKTQDSIRIAAEQHIRAETDLAIGKVWGFFRRGKRQLYLATRDKIAEQIRQDLVKYIEQRNEKSRERFARYSGLADALSKRTSPLKFRSDRERKQLQERLSRLQGSFERGMNVDGALSGKWREAQEAEDVITQHLLKADVVPAERLNDLFESNARGDRTLETIVTNSPAMASDPDLRRFVVDALRDLRRGDRKFYRLERRTAADPNVGTMQERLSMLRSAPSILGKKVSLNVAGAPADTRVVCRTDEDALVLKADGKQEYLILDTKTGEVTYRDPARVFHDYQLKETSFTLAS